MNEGSEDKKLLALGRELSEHLLRQSDQRDNEALLQARRRALQTIKPRPRGVTRHNYWLPATVMTGTAAAFAMVIILQWHGTSAPVSKEHDASLTNQLAETTGPWNENLDMLQSMDFTLWLDMAEPQDAG